MNILYGVSGEGLGHAYHASEIATALQKQGHKVLILTYGQAYPVLKKKFRVVKIEGVNFKYKNGEIQYAPSLVFLLWNFSKNLGYLRKFHKIMKSFKPSLCISDMEPVVPILSNLYRIPLVSISNQNRFTRFQIKHTQGHFKDYHLAKNLIRMAGLNCDWYIALSFSKLKKCKKKSFLSSPVIRREIMRITPRYENFILVYLSKENNSVLKILKSINERFVVYGCNVSKKEGNLAFKKSPTFLRDFVNCKAIISTSGFTSVGESIYLRKPYLAIPLKGQFEQLFNARFLKKYGLGDYTEKLTKRKVISFLQSLGKYRKNLEKYKICLENPVSILLKIISQLEDK